MINIKNMIDVKVYNSSNYPLPEYETLGAAGMDVRAAIDSRIQIWAGCRAVIPTGLYVEIPEGYEIQVRPRSGLALKKGVTVLNTPGTIDSDYRNQIGVILINTSNEEFYVEPGDRIAQIVLNQVPKINWVPVDSQEALSSTDRGLGGFGSTGKQ